ncbi:MAG: tripartite tricarboxylate transporter substrate binding protein [Betaproteobacteria bacterium]
MLGMFVAAALVLGASAAQAQFPARPIHFVSPWAPGGANDILARAIGNEISKSLGQPVIIENKPGASGTTGTATVAKAAPDGYTITLGSTPSYATAKSMYPALPYDPIRDFAPVTLVARVSNLLVVHPSVPATSVKELIAYAKANPGKLNFTSVGSGSTPHLSAELFKMLAGVEMNHVPYKGTAPALIDLIAGRVELAFEGTPALLPHVRANAVRALGITSARRSPLLPDVPSISETLPGFDVNVWYAVFAPAATPPEVVTRLNGAIVASLRTPVLSKQLGDLGAELVGSSPEELGAYLRAETAKWEKVIRAAGIKAN